jgi:hypothetical protein
VFVAPTGVSKDVAELVAPAGSGPGIAKHVDKFVDGDTDGIVGINVLGQTEARRIGGNFWFESAKKFVPDDERAAVIAVDIFGTLAPGSPT